MAKKIPKRTAAKLSCILDVDPVAEPEYKDGQLRKFLVSTPPAIVQKNRSFTGKEFLLFLALVVFTAFVRLRNLDTPNSVVFDEVHFGGFAKKYILGKFFMDVHPPLAKMLFAAVGLVGGFKGDFNFKKIGDVYPETTPYVFMRAFPAVLGVGTVLLAYLTLRNSGVRPVVAWFTAACFAVDNANATISRYILLDSPLLFFIASAVYALKKFEIQTPFSLGWWKALLATGIALGLAFSSKWVGLFTIAWVGLSCVYQLWFIIGDLNVSSKKVAAHFAARGAVLLGVPIVLYIVFFSIHFQLLRREGDGSAFMTSAFRSTLAGNNIPKDIVANVGYGSEVTIRHVQTRGGYLHSHNHFYPTGSKQQQITLYPHLDSNNLWRIEPYNRSVPDHFEPIRNNDKVRLVHVNTGRRLHSHDEKPPVSERDWQKEASCYGFDGFTGDANDDFVVEFVPHKSENTSDNLRAIQTVFRLKHAMTSHYLFSSEVKLPSWGFEQQEVTTAGQGYRPLTHWYIETNKNPLLDPKDAEIINYKKLSFWDKFVELHRTMWQINQGLTSHHNWQSNPTDWPLLLRGINYWSKGHNQVYFLGNAVVWWSSSIVVVVFAIHTIFSLIRWQSGKKVATNKNVFNFNAQVFLYLAGWGLHYIPFFIMGRQLFLHHYLPAAYFALLALGHVLDLFVSFIANFNKVTQRISYGFVGLFFVFSLLFYVNYSALVWGGPWTQSSCKAARVLSGWDFECNIFLGSLEEYASLSASASGASVASPEVSEPKETPAEVFQPPVAKEELHASPKVEAKPKPEEDVVAPPPAVEDGTK